MDIEKATGKVVAAFASLGQGLRMEEIAVVTGLAESTVLAVLRFQPELPRLPAFYDRGERGWFHDPPRDTRKLSMDQVCRPGARAV